MPLDIHGTVQELAESDLLRSPAQTESCVSKGKASAPSPKGCGVFSHKGLDYLIIPSGVRFAVIVLNNGNPFELEWTWKKKRRKDWSNTHLAKATVKMFYQHALKRNRLVLDESGRASLKPKTEAAKTVLEHR